MPNRIAAIIAITAISAFAGAAHAQSAADKAADAAISCLEIGDTAGRLACLETATREIKATRIRPETAEETATAEASGALLAAEDASGDDLFGAEALDSTKHAKREKEKTQRLEATVVEFRVDPFKNITAVLDNGQVWRQLSGDDAVIHLPKSEKVFTVTVMKGGLGNYRMKINELGRWIRVRRIK